MPRVLGIDPGTLSFDLCGLEDGRVFLEESIPTSAFAADPRSALAAIRGAGPLDLVAGPSGHGLPLTPVAHVGERELRLMCLAQGGEEARLGGLRSFVGLLKDSGVEAVITPGVIHLPTVPSHRKANRVDLGTADKVCAAAFAMEDQARHLGIPYGETAFVLVELGRAFTAVVAVEAGAIVSGQGGSSGPMGYLACGAMDAEAAFLLGALKKDALFTGGAAFVSGAPLENAEALALRRDEDALRAKKALWESVLKAVAAELTLVPRAREVLLSGRLSRIPELGDPLLASLSCLAPARHVGAPGKVKEAARGAALIADGLAGGAHRPLVESLRLREAAGTVLDHLFIEGADAVREWVRTAS
jgi:predicted butyrate kinase (DUF1464 family)